MRPSPRPIIIAARRSPLARLQAEWVGRALGARQPGVVVTYRWIESQGDQVTDVALSSLGEGKGLFTRTIEQAVIAGQADVAVHSLKDMDSQPTPGLVVAAIPPREDVRDCLIALHADCLDDLPQGATVGTAGPRRAAQIKRLRPDIHIELIRGNVQTRLRKVLEPVAGVDRHYDATLLAVAGLKRSGLGEYASKPIDPDVMLPAAGQGALAIQCRGDDHVTLVRCLPLNDLAASMAVHAERQIVRELGGDCHSPIAVLVEHFGQGQLRIRGRVVSPDGEHMAASDQRGPARQVKRLVRQTLAALRQQGCEQILAGATGR